MAGKKLTVIFDVNGDNKEIWIKGNEIAELLEYNDTQQTLLVNISNENKKIYGELLLLWGPVFKRGPKSNIQKTTIFINISGLFELLLYSKKNEAKQFQKWITNEVLPSLYKHGSYSIQQEKIKYKSLYDNKNITDFDKKNVVYIAYVGNYNNEEIFKYGKSSGIFKREYEDRRKLFDEFIMLFIGETDNNDVIENFFEQNLKAMNLHRKLTINNKNQVELFTITTTNNLPDVIGLMKDLINKKPLPALVEAKNKIYSLEQNKELKLAEINKDKEIEIMRLKNEIKIKREETKQLEIISNNPELIKLQILREENKKLQLELKKISEKNDNDNHNNNDEKQKTSNGKTRR